MAVTPVATPKDINSFCYALSKASLLITGLLASCSKYVWASRRYRPSRKGKDMKKHRLPRIATSTTKLVHVPRKLVNTSNIYEESLMSLMRSVPLGVLMGSGAINLTMDLLAAGLSSPLLLSGALGSIFGDT